MLLETKVVRCACIKWKSHVAHRERGCTKFVLLSHDLVELNWFFFFFLTDVLFKHTHMYTSPWQEKPRIFLLLGLFL